MPPIEMNLKFILQGCREGNRNSQRKLYELFHGYALNICLRYSKNREEAVEVMNDGFFKALTSLDKYDPTYPFKGWLRKILINAAIDTYRKNSKSQTHLKLTPIPDQLSETIPLPKLSQDEDVLPILQELSPAYRVVFNLYVMEGYKHHEIAELLGISVTTSRSNLVRAKENLRMKLLNKRGNPAKAN